jgi:DNA-binding beta-propeller fold protein YncE
MTLRGAARLFGAVAMLAFSALFAQAAPFMIIGNDEKLVYDEAGKIVLSPAGKDSVSIVDLANPENPKIVANLALKNSVLGPPMNLDIDPTGSVALVADAVDVTRDGDALKIVPDNKVYVIDLKANPPKLAATVTVGKQPSGLSFNAAGNLALVTNRADGTISVLSVRGTDVKVLDTVALGDSVTHVAFTPDGKRAIAAKYTTHKVSLLDVAGDKVTYTKLDLPTGQWPFNVAVAPSGKIALTADIGGGGRSDGSMDTVTVIDLEASPPRTIDYVSVGETPEGLAISPKGNIAVALIQRGSDADHKAYFYHKNGAVAVLRIDGKKVTKIQEIEVGGIPEAAMFTPDGKYLYVTNYTDQDVSILKVDGTKVINTGKRFKVPGHPGSGRMSPR